MCEPCGFFLICREQVPRRLGSSSCCGYSCIAKISGTSEESRDVQHALRTQSTPRKLAIIIFTDCSVGFRHGGVRATRVDAHRGRYCSPVVRPCLRLPGIEPAPFGLRLALGNQITLETGFRIHRPQTATMSIISCRLIDCRRHK